MNDRPGNDAGSAAAFARDGFVRGSGGPGVDDLAGFSVETQALACDLAEVFDDAFNLLLRKHENYGPLNVSASPGGALNGLRVRLHDKSARWNNMLDNQREDRVGEDLIETFTDALNYCAIAVLVLKNQWPGMESK